MAPGLFEKGKGGERKKVVGEEERPLKKNCVRAQLTKKPLDGFFWGQGLVRCLGPVSNSCACVFFEQMVGFAIVGYSECTFFFLISFF